MSGRRVTYRYGVLNAGGTLRIPREVIVQRGAGNEFVAISAEPAALGELFTLDRVVDRSTVSVPVCVVESRPAVVGGAVRHRLRLKAIGDAGAGDALQLPATGRPRTR